MRHLRPVGKPAPPLPETGLLYLVYNLVRLLGKGFFQRTVAALVQIVGKGMRINLAHVSQSDLVLLAVKRMCCTGGMCPAARILIQQSIHSRTCKKSISDVPSIGILYLVVGDIVRLDAHQRTRLAKAVAACTLDRTLYTAIQAKRRYLPGKRVRNGQSAVSQATGIATDQNLLFHCPAASSR